MRRRSFVFQLGKSDTEDPGLLDNPEAFSAVLELDRGLLVMDRSSDEQFGLGAM